ncbi:MAG: indole-3-glycerol phosphate synthase TrpC [Paludibacteraceae bacterium]|nr:indole-3-glycerol phosphate synthase TrpC [Paludibacteraceae bacterium]
MKDILEEIVANKRIEIEAAKALLPIDDLRRLVEKKIETEGLKQRSMRNSLRNSQSGIISEFKRKSPSKGWIHEDAKVTDVVPKYSANGASAISILTDEKYFGGNQNFIREVRSMIDTPILRKDFIVDEYQLYEAKLIGADAVLLIAADLTQTECKELLGKAHELGLEVLLEIHDEKELEYVTPEVDMLGVNNRHLGTFHTDVQQSFNIASLLPKEFTLVSESGISKAETVKELRSAGFRGFLIGENFMKEGDPGLALKSFIQQVEG